jgi:hypothetical protein
MMIMKTLLKITLFIAFVAVFASCQSSTDVKQILSNQDTKSAIMDSIANDSNLSKEMLGLMLNSRNSNLIMGEIHETMMKKMKDNPHMMQSMMTGMMETCKGDSAMMSSMCMSMMENPGMMDMMHKMMGGKMDMKGMKH